MPSASLNEIVLPAAERADLAERLAAFYEATDQAIATQGAVCRNRGLCCHFAAFGHRLYVSTVELAYFVRHAWSNWRPPDGRDDCPYHIEGRCQARGFRPLGCRVFFCDSETREWQGPEYETKLMELRRISDEFGVDYLYVEWLSALTELSQVVAVKQLQAPQD